MNSVGSLIFGSQPFFDDEGAPLALGYVVTKLAGTSTLQATFSDVGCTTPNANSVTLASTLRLDAGGFPVSPMYFASVPSGTSAVAYDLYLYDSSQVLVRVVEDIIVPAPSASANLTSAVWGAGSQPTYTISGGAITPAVNVFLVSPEGGSADNLDTIVVSGLPDGAPIYLSNTNGSAAITIRHGVGNIFTLDGQNLVLSTTNQRPTFMRYGANVRQVGPILSSQTLGNDVADGRLTLTSGNPVVDTSSSATVYYTPYIGNRIDLYDGVSAWSRLTFSELSLSVAATANGVYDIFAYNNAGVVTLELGTAWSTASTRAAGLSRQDGVLVLGSNTTRRYLGTIEVQSNLCHDRTDARACFNYYHRLPRPVSITETPDTSWPYNSAVWRVANNDVNNSCRVVCGYIEDPVVLTAIGIALFSAGSQMAGTAIGVDSTSSPSGKGLISGMSPGATTLVTALCDYQAAALLGSHVYSWLEYGPTSGTATFYGTSAAFAGGNRAGVSGLVWS